jgi:NAD(P)-dependent dehydrogenase (short-subunit alcohol dehydrogenase family)
MILKKMQDKIVKKIALVTGASTRIGKDIALFLAQNNWHVVIHYNQSENEAKLLCEHLNTFSKSIYLKADFNNLDNIDQLFAKISSDLGLVSLLINNAATFQNDHITNLSPELLNQHIKINCIAPITLSSALIKHNLKDKLNIINILDYSTLNPQSNFFSYNLSKSALLTATKQMALQLAPRCRVNAISPGYVLKASKQSQDHFDRMIQNSPLNIPTTTQQICDAIELILKCESMTGNNILIDSGNHLL